MPPRKSRKQPDERVHREAAAERFGTLAGRAESASPARKLPDARIIQARGPGCPCPLPIRVCLPELETSEQTLTWTQDSGFTEGKNFDTTTAFRAMSVPQNNGSNQPWVWFQGAHAYGKGSIHDLFLLDHVITAGEVSSLTDPSAVSSLSGLVAHWPFDESSGTTANDAGPNNYDGTYTGGVTLNGSAATFDGTDDYMTVSPAWGSLKTLTVGMWLDWDTFANDNRTLIDRGSQTGEVAIKITPNSDYSDNFSVEMWGADSGSGGYALAYCSRPPASETLIAVSFDINLLQQNSNYLGPRPKMRVWYGSVPAGGDQCDLQHSDGLLLTGNGTTVNLFPAAERVGILYYIKSISGTATIDPDGSETIDDASTKTLDAMETIGIVSDGTEWWAVTDYTNLA